jgi:hypothetical protein
MREKAQMFMRPTVTGAPCVGRVVNPLPYPLRFKPMSRVSRKCISIQDSVFEYILLQCESEKSFEKGNWAIQEMTGVLTFGNVPRDACRDSLLLAQGQSFN